MMALVELSVENLAVVESVRLPFARGFTEVTFKSSPLAVATLRPNSIWPWGTPTANPRSLK